MYPQNIFMKQPKKYQNGPFLLLLTGLTYEKVTYFKFRNVFDEFIGCITCRYITDGRTNYTFSATGEIRTIHDHIDCNSKNLIYMIHCLRCNKQYIGETKRRLKDRFNEHRRPVDRPTPSSRPTAVSDPFLSDSHSP